MTAVFSAQATGRVAGQEGWYAVRCSVISLGYIVVRYMLI
jgi:hypothetical protein